MTPRVVLVGPPGSGKSTVGELLAARLAVAFRDTDRDVEAAAGKPVSDIFIDDGEEHFRALEHASVAAALADHSGVLAVGAGAVLDDATRQALRGHEVVFLDVGLPEVVRRAGMARDRPLLLANPRAQMRRLLEGRRHLYLEVATATVSTDDRSPEQVVAAVEAVLDDG